MRTRVCLDPLEFAPFGNWLVPKAHTNFNKVQRNWPQHQFQHLPLDPLAVLTMNLTFSAPEKALPHRDNQKRVSKGQKKAPMQLLGLRIVFSCSRRHGG